MLDRSFIEKIEEMAKAEIIDVKFRSGPNEFFPRSFSTKKLYPVAEPTAATLFGATLQGVVDYVTNQAEKDAVDGPFIHVVDTHLVRVHCALEDNGMTRQELFAAVYSSTIFPFGQFLDVEEFVTRLMTQFVDAGDRADLLRFVGNLASEHVVTSVDDGVTQTATVRVGITKKAEGAISNPVRLAPRRTFPEIIQPESPFVVRLRPSNHKDQGMTVALFEADGGLWKVEAIQRIKWWLEDRVPEGTIILA